MIFLDTGGILCIFDRHAALHDRAASTYRSDERFVTHNYVLAEFVALTDSRRIHRSRSLQILDSIANNRRVQLHWVYPELHTAAVDLLRNRMDKRYSLCDAVSFVLMRQLGIQRALTTDHHFDQEGFQRLPDA